MARAILWCDRLRSGTTFGHRSKFVANKEGNAMTLEQIVALRNLVEGCDRLGLRNVADTVRGILAMDGPDDEEFGPIQDDTRQVRCVPMGLLKLLYPAYGHDQTLERMNERGGFGRGELGMLAVDLYSPRHPRLKRMPLLDLYEAARRGGFKPDGSDSEPTPYPGSGG